MLLNNTFNKETPLYQFFTGVLIVFSCTGLFGQVQFKLDKLADGETYQVSLIPQKTWTSPMNITSTAQVTLKVPTNSFEVVDLVSLHPEVNWEYNSKSIAPMESPNFDYLSFGLASMGTKKLAYEKGVEIPLFTFKNEKICQGSIELMPSNDPFKSPNSKRANVGNSITIFGAKGEAYTSTATQRAIPCQTAIDLQVTPTKQLDSEPRVYPNPAINELFVDLNWSDGTTKGAFVILDVNGQQISRQAQTIETGYNKVTLNVKKLPNGIFSIEFRHKDRSLVIDRFVKQSR